MRALAGSASACHKHPALCAPPGAWGMPVSALVAALACAGACPCSSCRDALSSLCLLPQVRVRGTLRLPSGDVNLVATQLALDRDHANLITFHPDQSGLDPAVDLVMTGGDLRVAIQVQRRWQRQWWWWWWAYVSTGLGWRGCVHGGRPAVWVWGGGRLHGRQGLRAHCWFGTQCAGCRAAHGGSATAWHALPQWDGFHSQSLTAAVRVWRVSRVQTCWPPCVITYMLTPRGVVQGKASEWQDHLTLHYISNKARPDGGEQLDAADAARIFEEKLKAALLAEDGQLALSRLAGTTVSTLMPKIETQGQVGGTRWRLVSAPSIPGLLSLDPSLADPSNILSSITMGTEVEIQASTPLSARLVAGAYVHGIMLHPCQHCAM